MSDIDQFKSRFKRLLELREDSDIKTTQAKKAAAEYRAYEAELWEAVNDAGVKGSLTFDFGEGNVRFTARKPTFYGRVVDKDVAIAALRQLGKDEIILQEAVREGRLNEYVRGLLETHTELPEGIDFYDRKGITISRK